MLCERAPMLRYTYIAYLVFSFCLNLVIIVSMATAITMTTSVAICSTSRCVVVAVVVSILLHIQEVIVCNSDRKPVKPDWGFVRFSTLFPNASTVPYNVRRQLVFIFWRVHNASQYLQLSDYPFLSRSYQFIIYYPSFACCPATSAWNESLKEAVN